MVDGEVPVEPPPKSLHRLVIVMVVLALVVLGGIALAIVRSLQPEAAEGPVRLAVPPSEGDAFTYRMTMGMDGTWSVEAESATMNLETSFDVDYRIQAVESDGTMLISMVLHNIEVSIDGRPAPDATRPIRSRIRVSPDGRIVEAGSDVVARGPPSQQTGVDQLFPSLPDEAIEPGATWDIDETVPSPFGQGRMIHHGRGRFLRYEEIEGIKAAFIETVTTSTSRSKGGIDTMAGLLGDLDVRALEDLGIDLALQAEGTSTDRFWIDPTNGELLRSHSEGDMSFGARAVGGGADRRVPPMRFDGTVSVWIERR